MHPNSPRPSIRDSLTQLVGLLDELRATPNERTHDAINLGLEQLERALGDEESDPRLSESLNETRRKHPRLISMCAEFDRDGRKLLRHAALVLRLSVRSCAAEKAAAPEVREAIASLVESVDKYLQLQEDLTGEAARDLGGEG